MGRQLVCGSLLILVGVLLGLTALGHAQSTKRRRQEPVDVPVCSPPRPPRLLRNTASL